MVKQVGPFRLWEFKITDPERYKDLQVGNIWVKTMIINKYYKERTFMNSRGWFDTQLLTI